jgi:hypothetical protein
VINKVEKASRWEIEGHIFRTKKDAIERFVEDWNFVLGVVEAYYIINDSLTDIYYEQELPSKYPLTHYPMSLLLEKLDRRNYD